MIRSSLKFALDNLKIIHSAIEIGVDRGVNSLDMLNAGIKKLYLIDQYKAFNAVSQLGDIPFTQEQMNESKREMLGKISGYNGSMVEFFEMSSVEAVKLFGNNSIDYIYIDAVHRYEEVKADIKAWFPKVRAGGILAGHDYKTCYCNKPNHSDCGYTGLRRAVDEFVKEYGLRLFTTTEFADIEEDWWIIK